ncbi:hypothetical protein D3C71_1898050 [compost metagenome]
MVTGDRLGAEPADAGLFLLGREVLVCASSKRPITRTQACSRTDNNECCADR